MSITKNISQIAKPFPKTIGNGFEHILHHALSETFARSASALSVLQ